jgi:hypothetical protein
MYVGVYMFHHNNAYIGMSCWFAHANHAPCLDAGMYGHHEDNEPRKHHKTPVATPMLTPASLLLSLPHSQIVYHDSRIPCSAGKVT